MNSNTPSAVRDKCMKTAKQIRNELLKIATRLEIAASNPEEDARDKFKEISLRRMDRAGFKKLLMTDPGKAAKVERCPYCCNSMQIGPETITERKCDKCSLLNPIDLDKKNPQWAAYAAQQRHARVSRSSILAQISKLERQIKRL